MVGACCRSTSSCGLKRYLNHWGVDIDSCINGYRYQPYLVLNTLHVPGYRGDRDSPATTKCCSNGTCAQTLNDYSENPSVLRTRATL